MKARIACLILVVALFSCTPTPLPEEDILKNKSYVHLFFKTEQECLDNQPEPDFFYNCHQQVDFYEDNRAEIMLTDIIYRGEYRIEGNIVILTFDAGPEIPGGEIFFEILNPNRLVKTDNNTVWTRIRGDSIWD